MKHKKFLALALAFVMLFGATGVYAAEPFGDVAEDAYFADAVSWAVEQGITQGRGEGIFDPDATVTRAEAVTFLWRMAGEPEPTQTETFADVESDGNNAWYKTAVQWAVEQGLTNGTGDGNFSPTVTCERGMILTMLYRLEDSPYDAVMEAVIPEDSTLWTMDDLGNSIIQELVKSLRAEDGVTDVEEGAYYELPIYWAMLSEILDTNQLDDEIREAHPTVPCPRGEMVYFLYRAAAYEEAAKAAEEMNKPLPPVETGTVAETVLLDKDKVKITLTGIHTDDSGEPELELTMVNGTDKTLTPDITELFVNSYRSYASTYIPVKQENMTTYDSVLVSPGETKRFNAGLGLLRDMGISAVYEIELEMALYEVTVNGDEMEYEQFSEGDAVRIETSLYEKGRSYDPEGITVYEEDGLKILVTKAENNAYMGPQITVSAFNSGSEPVFLELTELKLDGKTCNATLDLEVFAGKWSADTVFLAIDGEDIQKVSKAELTFAILDEETWDPLDPLKPLEPSRTLEPVTVTFES